MSTNQYEGGRPREFMPVQGFSNAEDLGMIHASVSESDKGKYNFNNGVIAAVKSNGEIMVWVPSNNENRTTSFTDAINNLKQNGYTKGSFGVPTFI